MRVFIMSASRNCSSSRTARFARLLTFGVATDTSPGRSRAMRIMSSSDFASEPAAVAKITQMPDTREKLDVHGLNPIGSSVADFTAFQKAEAERWAKVIKAAEGADKKLIAGVSIFDLFESDSLGAGKKSLAIEVTLQPAEKTLTDDEIDTVAKKVVAEVIKDGFLDQHVPTIRARYHAQRDAMLAALARELGPTGAEWTQPVGGMFVWVRLPERLNAQALLPKAVDAGMAFVPGAPFYAGEPDARALRLSFVTSTPEQIDKGMAALGRVVQQAMCE